MIASRRSSAPSEPSSIRRREKRSQQRWGRRRGGGWLCVCVCVCLCGGRGERSRQNKCLFKKFSNVTLRFGLSLQTRWTASGWNNYGQAVIAASGSRHLFVMWRWWRREREKETIDNSDTWGKQTLCLQFRDEAAAEPMITNILTMGREEPKLYSFSCFWPLENKFL